MKKLLPILVALGSTQASAMQCYLTLMQGKCWQNYEITIQAVDGISGDEITKPITLSAKKGDPMDKFWKRVPFDCKAKEGISLKASFSPPIWATDKDKIYPGTEIIYLPETIKKGIFAWNVPVCFPSSFENIPIPPSATDNCDCTEMQKLLPKITKDEKTKN